MVRETLCSLDSDLLLFTPQLLPRLILKGLALERFPRSGRMEGSLLVLGFAAGGVVSVLMDSADLIVRNLSGKVAGRWRGVISSPYLIRI